MARSLLETNDRIDAFSETRLLFHLLSNTKVDRMQFRSKQ